MRACGVYGRSMPKEIRAESSLNVSFVSSGTTADYHPDTKAQKREVDAPDDQQDVPVDEAARVDSDEPDNSARPS
jgi:hypothetical protein